MNILSSFIHLHGILKLLLNTDTQLIVIINIELFHFMDNKKHEGILQNTFFRFLLKVNRTEFIQNMRVSKWWQNVQSWLSYPFIRYCIASRYPTRGRHISQFAPFIFMGHACYHWSFESHTKVSPILQKHRHLRFTSLDSTRPSMTKFEACGWLDSIFGVTYLLSYAFIGTIEASINTKQLEPTTSMYGTCL